ncbi:hypothetical protein CAEBREN_15100 [Caenorhabditis brenneri]|uniref:WW domain-containing protein n=1 Tax=Caenorhabditis brenneri TaxID=135651 RepID=G0MI72_CAEBE|nr:hypothetical protein CAEBREN_15100 [Caenorhabditis brenneri]
MAYKRIQFTHFVDPEKDIRDLIRPEKKYEKNPNPKKQQTATLPPSFYKEKSRRPRESSAGHSPQVPSPSHMGHGGSVDEVASSSRTAVSPAMGTTPNQPIHPIHKRQFSAPELHPDYSTQESSVSSLPPMSIGFPPVPQHVKSVSHETYSYAGYSDTQPQHGMPPSNREKSSSLDPMRRPFMTPQDVEQLPMPHGWEICYDSEGHRYFKDHNTKSTQWNDPRLIPQEQGMFSGEEMGSGYNNYFDSGHSSRSLPSIHQQPQMMPSHPQPQYSSQQQIDYIQQLQNERMMIQEKNAQLMNSGLLDSPQQQNYQAISPINPMMLSHEQNFMYQQQQQGQSSQQSQPQQPQHNMNQMQNQFQNNQMSDSAMEVDYSIPPHPQQQHQHQPQPQMHRNMQNNYGIDDINPHEFDQYLQISNDNNRGVGSMVHHYQ